MLKRNSVSFSPLMQVNWLAARLGRSDPSPGLAACLFVCSGRYGKDRCCHAGQQLLPEWDPCGGSRGLGAEHYRPWRMTFGGVSQDKGGKCHQIRCIRGGCGALIGLCWCAFAQRQGFCPHKQLSAEWVSGAFALVAVLERRAACWNHWLLICPLLGSIPSEVVPTVEKSLVR